MTRTAASRLIGEVPCLHGFFSAFQPRRIHSHEGPASDAGLVGFVVSTLSLLAHACHMKISLNHVPSILSLWGHAMHAGSLLVHADGVPLSGLYICFIPLGFIMHLQD